MKKSGEESYRSRWLYSRSWHARGHHHPWHHRWHHAWHLIKEASWNIHLAFPYHLVQAEVLRHSVRQGVCVCVCVCRGLLATGGEGEIETECCAYLMVWCHSLWSVKQQQHTKLHRLATFSDLCCCWHFDQTPPSITPIYMHDRTTYALQFLPQKINKCVICKKKMRTISSAKSSSDASF